MISRKEYLEEIIAFRETDLVKVITGIRRCGKSTLFELYQEYLLKSGVESSQIITVNMEDFELDHIKTAKDLYDYIKAMMCPEKMNYIFIDEVQMVPEFQRAVDGLYIKKNSDVYITGSNAYLLSSELATLLSGRYVEVKMLPLSFKEYVDAVESDKSMQELYSQYLVQSSFPYAIYLKSDKARKMYLESIIDSILIKDILVRRKYPEIEILKSVLKFAYDNIGNLTSCNKIANTLTSNGRKVTVNTVEGYMSSFIESYIFYEAKRYDIKGKQHLKTGAKYYASDIGLRYAMLGSKPADLGHMLENVVYLELLRRGYEVYIGKIRDAEVDFIAINDKGTEYYQVAYTVLEPKTLQRELASLDAIRDHNPKYLLTMDQVPYSSHNGIKQINVLDWLMNK